MNSKLSNNTTYQNFSKLESVIPIPDLLDIQLASFEDFLQDKIDLRYIKYLCTTTNKNDDDEKLINELLSWMDEKKADFTNTFCVLMEQNIEDNKIYNDENFIKWKNKWKKRIKLNNKPLTEAIDLMRSVNPLVVPRNHKVEEVLNSANSNNLKPLEKFLEVLKKPYENKNNTKEYQLPAPPGNEKYQTFCGT